MLKRIEKYTNVIILDFNLQTDILNSIKNINAKIEIVMLSTNEDIGIKIESIINDANELTAEEKIVLKKRSSFFNYVFANTIRLIVNGFIKNKLSAAQ